MKKLALLLTILLFSSMANAKSVFTGQNYSGTYNCKGSNEQVGDYEVTVRLKLNRVSSYGHFGAYYYETETENSVVYNGHAIADGNRLSIALELSEGRNSEPSVGTAVIKRDENGRLSFRKNYYEPDDNGGNYGSEHCSMVTKAGQKVLKKQRNS